MLAVGLALAMASAPQGDSWHACADADAETAIIGCTAVIAAGAGPELAAALYNRAIAYRAHSQRDRAQRGDAAPGADDPLDQAIADYDAAIRLKPDFAEALVNRGIAWFDKGRYDRTIADSSRAIELRPDLAEAFNNRALAYYKQGRYALAQPDFDRTIRLRKNYGNALILRSLPPVGGSPRASTPDEP
ncbi:MAG: tetratricopeptide repeat protein [Sphingomonadales bacterium]|nr:tetratricopeptide repeat protein [Sphingomonadales bacterium]